VAGGESASQRILLKVAIALGRGVGVPDGRMQFRRLAPELPSTVAPPQATTLEGLQSALEASVGRLSEAVGIEVIEQDYLDGELSRSIWARSWPNGDYVSVENTDLSVAEGGSSDIVATRARVQIGDMLYTAGTGTDGVGSPWRVVELTETPLQKGQHFLPI
jgi:hypothetical protein